VTIEDVQQEVSARGTPQLVARADELRRRLRKAQAALFAAEERGLNWSEVDLELDCIQRELMARRGEPR
jgi:hypothetical protein